MNGCRLWNIILYNNKNIWAILSELYWNCYASTFHTFYMLFIFCFPCCLLILPVGGQSSLCTSQAVAHSITGWWTKDLADIAEMNTSPTTIETEGVSCPYLLGPRVLNFISDLSACTIWKGSKLHFIWKDQRKRDKLLFVYQI